MPGKCIIPENGRLGGWANWGGQVLRKPKKNDLYSLKKVRDDIVKIQNSVDDQLSRLRKFDDTLFENV